jgi:hypothetical protein
MLPKTDLYSFTTDQYHKLIDARIVRDGDGIELLDGSLYRKGAFGTWSTPTMVDADDLYRLSRRQFRQLVRAEILLPEDRVEFVEGLVLRCMTLLPPHSGAVIRLNTLIGPMVRPGWRYRQEQPLILTDGEPEPDGLIATGTEDDNYRFHPTGRDVELVIEVADSSLVRDRGIKLSSYARAGISCYWIVNLVDRQIEVYTHPDAAADDPIYRDRAVFTGYQAVEIIVAGESVGGITTAAILPPP